MKSGFDKHRESVERFVRSENVARFRRMLETEQNESERRILLDLIDQEIERQMDAFDFGLKRPQV